MMIKITRTRQLAKANQLSKTRQSSKAEKVK